MDVRPIGSRRRPLLAAVLLFGLVIAGCSGDGSEDSGSTSDTAAEAPAAAPQQGNPEYNADKRQADQQGSRPEAATTLGSRNRALIYKGSLTVTAKDVPDAAARAITTAQAAGGYVAADQRRVNADDRITVTLTLRVPSSRFTTTIDTLSALGTERSRELGTEDLQPGAVDLDSRIAAQRASVARVRALLGRANSITELASIERELTSRESELAALESSRRTVNDQVSLSTITLNLSEPADAPKAAPKEERGLLVGLRNGWNAFVATLTVLLMVLGWLAPFLAAAALVGVPIWLLVRRFRRRSARPTSPAASAGPTTPNGPGPNGPGPSGPGPNGPTGTNGPTEPTRPTSPTQPTQPSEPVGPRS
ncbi:DUF4349 domain-containing protein [Cryptosporangium minutisporangium]|uniref:DUF4349 domain-containing protein n=1 Tax=Cryptosporangium minutisporangium TaxID=113569 RepID=A0ABP6TD65_9ACTN